MSVDLINNNPIDPDYLNNLISWGQSIARDSSALDAIKLMSGYGTTDSSITGNYYGFNHSNSVSPMAANNDNAGLLFFTKPRMNLTYDNIARERIFTNLAVGDDKSLGAIIRAYLDPRGARAGLSGRGSSNRGYPCPLVDNKQAFIPFMTNYLVSASGWPDPFVDTFTTDPGRYNEQFSMVDGFAKLYGIYQITAVLKNTIQDPVSMFIFYWVLYGALVHEGKLDPYLDSILLNEIDYNTRIYRLTLDSTKTYVTKMAATIAFPTMTSLGDMFNYNKDEKVTKAWDDVSVTFQCMGAEYMDPILTTEFNAAVVIFNPEMNDNVRERRYRKLTAAEKQVYNYLGYPRIDPITSELQWWVDEDDFNEVQGFML